MKLSGTQIRSLIEKKEDERVEFKRASSELPDNIWETYSAFCNTDGITRIDDTPVHKALREVLANALIHADYHGRRGIVVEKHFRTITFSNPGTMRGSKSVAVAGGTSDARNSAIFNIFALVDIGERSGMGLANLHGLWKKYGYAEPKITESYDPDRTVLVVTTDDDTVNDTVTRPENSGEPDQNSTRTRPEPDQKSPNGAPRGDNKVDNKVDIKVDNRVDNNVWDDTANRSRIDQGTTDDTVNDTVKRLQTRTRTTTPYNTRTRSVQNPHKKRRRRLGRNMDSTMTTLSRHGDRYSEVRFRR